MQQQISENHMRKGSNRFWLHLLLGLGLLILMTAASISFGAANMSLSTAWGALFHYNPNLTEHLIIRTLRFPRTIADLIVGCSLAVCGAIMQGTTRNPLADSGLMGISQGAGFAVALCLAFSMNLGKMNLSSAEVFHVIMGNGTKQQNLIVFGFRLPEITLSLLVGIGMGASGCIMQSLLRNDMASPGTLGISSGSGLFVLIFIVLFSEDAKASAITMPLLAFVGGIIAAALIFILSYRRGREISPTGLILTGVALGSGYGAVTMLLILKLKDWQMDFFQKWNAGSLWGAEWKYIIILAPWTFLLLAYVFYKARILNAIHLGNQTATGLGVAIKPEFLGLSLASIALSSGCVALGGNFFFVGMIAPHMAKKLVGSNHKLLLPAASLAGAIIVLLGDTLTRTVSLGADIPAGIIITVLSIPYFLYLLAKSD